MRIQTVFTALAILAAASGTALAQTPAQPPAAGGQRAGGAPAPFKNLQVLPKDISRQDLTETMRAFNAALGVQCTYCHAYIGPGDPKNDMASDDKAPKLVARVMLQMTNDINARLAANIKKPADQITKVACATCHRGSAIPMVPPAAAAPGTPGAAGPASPAPAR
jgi:hypothetical protein